MSGPRRRKFVGPLVSRVMWHGGRGRQRSRWAPIVALACYAPCREETVMSQTESIRGHAVVMQPKDGVSYWHPVPANGHADPKLCPANTRYDGLSMGFQTV